MNKVEDPDPDETQDWLESLKSVILCHGTERGLYLLEKIEEQAQQLGIIPHIRPYSAYQNTIQLESQTPYPGNLEIEEHITAIIRWNALAMVIRANQAYGGLGGHIASYTSAAEIFEMGFNHFFRAGEDDGDLVYFQPHSAPGIYARAFLEGRLDENQLANYRQEINGNGLSSYCHPWLMPEFWQFPTGSMGIGPITAIYNARFMRYLEYRGIKDNSNRYVWGVFGDGEMDEPESIGALTLASRENLDNLTFIINCNLQRLDGPVRGNGQIIQELDSLFTGAGWNVIKVLWGCNWDPLFARDSQNVLLKHFASTVDGQFQTLGANDGAYNVSKFFQSDPDLNNLVGHMTHEEVNALKRGGHDFKKLYVAFEAARNHKGQPTVILAKTKKGYGMGRAGESRMTAHQNKILDIEALKSFCERFGLPLNDEDISSLKFYRPSEKSPQIQYLKNQRQKLGGYIPARRSKRQSIDIPNLESYGLFALKADGKVMSTTTALIRLLSNLLKNNRLNKRIVPIVADEARTFGMADLFRRLGIYSPHGQLYEPEDAKSLLYYRESKEGQLLEEGITEAGAMSSWISAATSYSTHNTPMLPFYIYYSMFGFQRVGDIIWSAADQRSRGFLIGATSGRTTLSGEGLQHQDGSSHVVAATIPNCRAYDPAFSYELAVIFDYGCRRMMMQCEDEFFYLTVMNEKYSNPSMPPDIKDHIINGLYKFQSYESGEERVQLLGSGAILLEIIKAAELLAEDWGISCDVWSVTSYSELSREAQDKDRYNRLHPKNEYKMSHLEKCLGSTMHIIAASDYVRALPQLISPYLSGHFTVLGTDGFGRSDTRTKLRSFFEVNYKQIILAALYSLSKNNNKYKDIISDAIKKYNIDPDKDNPAFM